MISSGSKDGNSKHVMRRTKARDSFKLKFTSNTILKQNEIHRIARTLNNNRCGSHLAFSLMFALELVFISLTTIIPDTMVVKTQLVCFMGGRSVATPPQPGVFGVITAR